MPLPESAALSAAVSVLSPAIYSAIGVFCIPSPSAAFSVLHSVLVYGIYAWATANKLIQCSQDIHGRPRSSNHERPQDAYLRSLLYWLPGVPPEEVSGFDRTVLSSGVHTRDRSVEGSVSHEDERVGQELNNVCVLFPLKNGWPPFFHLVHSNRR